MTHPKQGSKLNPDLYVGATLLGFCGLVYWNTTTFREVPAMLSQNVPPTFFPRLILAVITTLSLALILSAAKRAPKPREKIPRGVAVTAVIILVTVALIPRLGMLSSLCLASIVMPFVWGERRVLRVALLAVLLPSIIYLIFVLAFDMRFPRGLLP